MNEEIVQQPVYEEPQPQPIPRKKSWWEKIGGGSLTFAIIFHVILLIIGAIWIFQIIPAVEKKVDFMPAGEDGGGGERAAQTKVNQKKRAQITPSTNVKRVFAEGAKSNFAMPERGDSFGEMSPLSSLAGGGMSGGLGGSGGGQGFGKGKGNGNGFGGGGGTGKMFGLIPENMKKRCSKQDRLARLNETGGTPACEEAVVKALQWFKSHQNPDGSWGASDKCAMTGLVLLAYFGHCETPVSEEFGESCLKGIIYLVGVGMKNNGQISANARTQRGVYEHAIGTYALGEAATFCKDLKVDVPGLMDTTQKAGQFIIENQNENGGWAYSYQVSGGHTDTSVVGWQLQALKACSHTELKYDNMNKCVERGLKYLLAMQNANGGFGYSGPGGSAGGAAFFKLTGVGVLCHQMWGKTNIPEVTNGLKYIKANAELDWEKESSDLYSHYYMSQAMMQGGDKYWSHYNELFRDQILKNQNSDGSWKTPAAKMHGAQEVYKNALCTLMLEVYYRFLNSTGTGGGIQRGPRKI